VPHFVHSILRNAGICKPYSIVFTLNVIADGYDKGLTWATGLRVAYFLSPYGRFMGDAVMLLKAIDVAEIHGVLLSRLI
jgi:hypothetical protein